jgi:hypothetical protein
MRWRAVTLVGAVVAVAIGSYLPPSATVTDAGQAISSCDQAGLEAAVSAGGVWTVDCPGQTLNVASSLVVAGGDVTLEYSGGGTAPEIFNPGFSRLFTVSGGSLTLRGLTLQGGTFSLDPLLPAQGGAIFIAVGAHVELDNDFIQNSGAQAANRGVAASGTSQNPDGQDATGAASAAQGEPSTTPALSL